MKKIPFGTCGHFEGRRLGRAARTFGGNLVQPVKLELHVARHLLREPIGGSGVHERRRGAERLVQFGALHAFPVVVVVVAVTIVPHAAVLGHHRLLLERARIGGNGVVARGCGGFGGGGARDGEIVVFEGNDDGNELGEKVGENEADENRLEEGLPLGHGG